MYKWKARLNLHGGRQEKFVNYWDTFAATLRWSSIRFFLIQSLINDWHTRQIDFILAFPQAKSECKMFMEIPRGYQLTDHKRLTA